MVVADLPVPVVAAPMAGGPSTPDLVAAVGDAGGLGFLAGGYLSTEALARQVADVWDASNRPFGVNLFVPQRANTYPSRSTPAAPAERSRRLTAYRDRLLSDADEVGVELPDPDDLSAPRLLDDGWDRKLDLVLRERVAVVSFTFGLPGAAVFSELARAGIESVVTVTDPTEAQAAEAAGADVLCVHGPGAGGHRGTLDPDAVPDERDLPDLVAAVRAVVGVPIIAGGGLASPSDAAEVLRRGADAVQLGTAFLLTPEAGTALAHRRALKSDDFASTVVTRAFSGRLARALENDFVRRHHDHAPAAYPEVHHLTVPLRRAGARDDRPDGLALWAGTGWASAEAVPAATVVARFATALASHPTDGADGADGADAGAGLT